MALQRTDSDLKLEPVVNTISSLKRDDIDLQVENGDLAIVSYEDLIKAKLFRRLQTPVGSYALNISTYTDLGNILSITVDESYGSKLGLQNSEPLNNNWITNFINLITEALNDEPYISISNIDLSIFDPANGKVTFIVNYTINGTDLSGTVPVSTN